MLKQSIATLLYALSFYVGLAQAQVLDRIVAVVEEDVILERELNAEVAAISNKLNSSNVMVPPEFVLRKQVLERMVVDKLQRQMAAKSGIQISDEMLHASVADIAARNGLSVDAFRSELARQGMDYKSFEDNLRNEIIINQLRGREIGARVKVTDAEVQHYLETQSKAGQSGAQYHLGHILIAVPEGASASAIQKAKDKADQVIADLRGGKDFKQVAVGISDGDNALKGGDLGWRGIGQIPSLFTDIVGTMNQATSRKRSAAPAAFTSSRCWKPKAAASISSPRPKSGTF